MFLEMPTDTSQQFLRDLDKKLWTDADPLRANLDPAVYKHSVLGLIFLKYVSDSFAVRQAEIETQLRDPKSDYFLDQSDFGSKAEYEAAIREELEERDYYIEKNVFWVPALARWKTLQDSAKLPPGTEIEVTNGKKATYKITSAGKLIDDALDAVEREGGQYFTPKSIVSLIVEMLDPYQGRVFDPAMGSGGLVRS
jgi:type I restriction enzyme M protein